jgi:hypothetical protein
VGVPAVLALLGLLAWWWVGGPLSGSDKLRDELGGHGRVLRLGSGDLRGLSIKGTEFVEADELPDVKRALGAAEPEPLVSALQQAEIGAVLVEGHGGGKLTGGASLSQRLKAYGYIRGLRGVHLTPAAALYEVDPMVRMRPPLGEALVRVARGILGGERPPRVSSFPRALRRIHNVEVMVLLREDGRPRLWRSARGSSIARALNTAAGVARQRWKERQTAMGGPLEEHLPGLAVEVSLLIDDGTLGGRDEPFLERAVTPVHGVGYERKGSWRYLLPEARREAGEGSAAHAFEALFEKNGLDPEAKGRPDVRLYRLVVQELARSAPPADASSGEVGGGPAAEAGGSSSAGAPGAGADSGSGG